MAFVTAPTFPIKSISWTLDQPGQTNLSAWTGTRTAVVNPWHGTWSAKVQLAPIVGEANVRALRSFMARCRGVLNTFRLYATEGPQNANSGVTVAASVAAGVRQMTISGAATPLFDGQFVTVNGQLLQLVADQSGSLITFEPMLRQPAAAGTIVVTSRPYALVYMANSQLGWSVDVGKVYGISFDVGEAVLEADGTAPEAGSATPPPVLTSPTATASGSSGATLGVSTDTGNGTWFWSIDESATTPTAAQIMAGEDNTGAGATAHDSQAVSATGEQSATASGLDASTTYYAHYAQENDVLGISVAITSPPFTTSAAATKFLAEGDSITALTSPASYSRLWAADHPTITYTDNAVGGGVTGSPGDTPPTNSLYARQAGDLAWSPTHMSVLIGANDISGSTVASTYLANLYNYLAPFKSAGVKIVLCTVLPRTGVTGQEAARGAVNTQLRADKGTQFDDLVDFDTCLMGEEATPSDPTYYDSGLHPTAVGMAILERVYAPVVNHWLGIPNEPLDFTFAPQSAATLDTDYDSPAYTVTGLYPGETRPYSVSAGGKISKNGGAYVLNGSGTVVNDDTISVLNHSATTNATDTDVSATIGTTTAIYTVTTAGAGTRDWVPTDLGSKLAAWLKPEDYAATADAATITTWHDSSDNGANFASAGSSGGPQCTTANGLNGFNAAYFSGHTGSYFTPATSPSTYLSGRTSTATFSVSRNTAQTGGSSPFCGWGSNGDEFFAFSGNGDIYSGYGSNARHDLIPVGSVDLTAWHVINFQSAASDWEIYIDGTQLYQTTSNVVGLGTAPKLGLCSSTGAAFNGYLEEIVDLNAVPTTTERQKIEGYLAWKYGLEANLPLGHPYAAAAPTA